MDDWKFPWKMSHCQNAAQYSLQIQSSPIGSSEHYSLRIIPLVEFLQNLSDHHLLYPENISIVLKEYHYSETSWICYAAGYIPWTVISSVKHYTYPITMTEKCAMAVHIQNKHNPFTI